MDAGLVEASGLPGEKEGKNGPAHYHMYELSAARAQPTSGFNSAPPRLVPGSDDYYPTVAIKALMNILRDPSLSAHHSMVTQAVIFIFKSLGLRCVPFLDHIIPNMLQVKSRFCLSYSLSLIWA